jgi:hypothetical protein
MMLGAMLLFPILAICQTGKPRAEENTSSATEDLRLRLDAPVRNYSLTEKNFLQALTTAAGDFKIPMGIQWVVTPEPQAGFTHSWNSGTVEQVITKIVKTQPGYEIQIRNGVLHVLAPELIPDRQNFLKLVIAGFEVNQEHIEVATDKLYRMVYRIVFPPPPGIPGGILTAARMDEPTIDLDVDGNTVEEILDAFIVRSKRKTWIVTFSSDTATTETGFRPTVSPSCIKPSSDGNQRGMVPFHFDKLGWLLLHWGDALPTALRQCY